MRDETTSGLNRAVKAGAAWVVAERGALQFLNLAGGVVLARLLAPSDFGVMALAFLVTGLATRLLYMGFGMALVQRETIRPDHVSTMFVMALVINSVLFLGVLLIAPYAGAYFHNPLVGDILALMSFTFVIRSFAVCPTALLRRRMDFRARATGSIIDSVVKLMAAVVLALAGFGAWSLAYGELSGAVAEKVYLIVASGWRPGVRVTRSAFADLFGFGAGISLKSSVIFLSERVDNFIVGKWLGTASLGLYERAYNLMDVPVRELAARMNVVLFPAFSRIQQEPGRLRAAYRKTVLSLSVVCYPIFGSLIVLAPEFIEVVYGRKWLGAILPFQILCLAGLPRVLAQVTGSLINAMGSVGREVMARGVALVLLLGGALIGSRWGIAGVAAAVALVNLGTLALIVFLVQRVSPITLKDVLQPQATPFRATIALVVSAAATKSASMTLVGMPALLALPTTFGAGILAYAVVLYLKRDEPLMELLGELRRDVQPLVDRLWRVRPRRARRQASYTG